MRQSEPEAKSAPDSQIGIDRARGLARDSGHLSLQRLRQYVPLVKTVINRLGGYLPPDVPESTLIGRGLLALMEAAENYSGTEPDFTRLADKYIWRAVTSTLRQSSCFTAESQQALARLEAAYHELSVRGQEASDEALAQALEVSVAQVREYLAKISALFAVLPAQVLQVSSPGPDLLASWQQHIARAIAHLPQAEQLVVALYYFEDLTFPEIAEVLEMEVARVQQLFGRAALLVRAYLAKQLAKAA